MVVRRGKPNFTEGPMFTRLLLFTLPIIATSLLSVIYHMADNIVVGQFSGDNDALAAVGQTAAYSSLLVNLLLGISGGAGVVVAQLFGAGRREELSRAIRTSILISLVLGTIMAIFGLVASRPILSIIIAEKNHAALLDKATLYMLIVSAGLPGAALYQFASAILRSLGDSRSPLIVGAASGLLNVGLNLVFVICFNMSIAGVALATIISQYLSSIVVTYLVMKNSEDGVGFRISELMIDKRLLGRIFVCGVPASLQSAIFSLANMIMASAISTFPVDTISANTIASNIDNITYQCMNGFMSSVMTFVGQNYGAMKKDRIWKCLFYGMIQVTVIGIGVAWLELALADPLCQLFIGDGVANPAVIIDKATEIMRSILIPYFICGLMGVLSGFLRGMGNSIAPMIVAVSVVLVVRFTWIFCFFPMQPDSITWLYLCYPITWILTLAIDLVIAIIETKKLDRIKVAEEKAVEATV